MAVGRPRHVIPALLRRFHVAVQRGDEEVVVWGSGKPMREFLHVDDMAAASVTGFGGRLSFDATKPDGTPRKLMDVSRLKALGWQASISLEAGLRDAYGWYVENVEKARTQ